jgi:hypothetical protein
LNFLSATEFGDPLRVVRAIYGCPYLTPRCETPQNNIQTYSVYLTGGCVGVFLETLVVGGRGLLRDPW